MHSRVRVRVFTVITDFVMISSTRVVFDERPWRITFPRVVALREDAGEAIALHHDRGADVLLRQHLDGVEDARLGADGDEACGLRPQQVGYGLHCTLLSHVAQTHPTPPRYMFG
jgi:hypothetical protein